MDLNTWAVLIVVALAFIAMRLIEINIGHRIGEPSAEQQCENRIKQLEADMAEQKEHYESRIKTLEEQVFFLVQELQRSGIRIRDLESMPRAITAAADQRRTVVLGIWPQSNLDTASERDSIMNAGIEYRALFGKEANRGKIIQELRTGEITIIEIGAHGTESGAVHMGAYELPAGWWQNVVASKGIKVALLLSCYSDNSMSDAMRRAGVGHVIAVVGELEDQAAIDFTREFYRLYAEKADVQRAFYEAKLVLDHRQAEKLVLRNK